MSDRVTVAQARAIIARVALNGIPSGDPRVLTYLNEATQRLMNEGKLFVGMVAEVLMCTQAKCFTLPSDLESVLELYIPDESLDVPTGWYTIENPSSYVDPDYINDLVLVDRGEHPTVFDLCGASFLKLYSTLPEATGLQLHIFGTDENGMEIFTNVDGDYQPGELVPLSAAGVVTQNQYSSITNIQKPLTNSPLSLFTMVPAAGAVPASEVLLAIFDRNDYVPTFRRYYCEDIPLPVNPAVPTKIRITGKRRYKPVLEDTDYLIISNLPALKMEVLAIDAEETGSAEPTGAQYYHGRAVELLTNEAKNFQFDPTKTSSRKAQYSLDEQTYSSRQLGYVRAKLCLESPNLLKVGQRLVTRAINNAQLRLMGMANFRDSVQSLSIKLFEGGWLILPNQVEAILTLHRGSMPLLIRSPWFEAQENGPGLTDCHACPSFNLIDRAVSATFVDIKQPTSIAVQTNETESADVGVRLLGFDQNNQWVQTLSGTNLVDGEFVKGGAVSTTTFLKVTGTIKPITKGTITLSSSTHPILALLPAGETTPMFRRYWVPGAEDCCDCIFTAQVKFRHSDITHAEEIVTISNYAAIKAMVTAIALEDTGKITEAQPYEAVAVKILQNELKAHRGRQVSTLTIQTRGFGGSRIYQGR